MSLINELTKFLKDNLPADVYRGQKFTSFMDNLEIDRVFKQITKKPTEQLLCAKLKYDAVITFDEFPYRVFDPCLVFALVMCWLESKNCSDAQFDSVNPDIDVSENDEQTAYLMISVPLIECITLIEDENGAIPYKGRRYRLGETSIWMHPEDVNINAN
ncbi:MULTISPECIES: phage tail protein [unclassified Gilliamella]|uniref:phage tail protein n=1 Tax=unclassified Gilliamella TaxID=2685620 RepID=UPI002269EF5E|nr:MULTISPECIES: phage tail protein [unclassified Gilliamella]MCX8587289.1 phage tail protein [Gilliamella sp. B3801]MCX8591956.1 phage tail protein [Gilliamella sp. B3804]